MVNATVVDDKYTLRGRIWVHLSGETIKILYELIAIVPSNLDVTVNYAVHGDFR